MSKKFAEIRKGTLNKFFTKVSVGEVLANLLDDNDYNNVLDLGAGEGALCVSVLKKSPSIDVVTVDIDSSTSKLLKKNLSDNGCKNHTHYIEDVLSYGMMDFLALEHGEFDLAVCNPPFFNPNWDRKHADILQNAGLSDACRTTNEATAEILFISHSLSLLRPDGQLAVIVPDSLITTSRALNFRRSLVQNHNILKVAQLPINSFWETDAQCSIIFLRKGKSQNEAINLLRVKEDLSIDKPIQISNEQAIARMDYNFHSLRRDTCRTPSTLKELGAEVVRGSLSTVQYKSSNLPAFHTSDYKYLNGGDIELPESDFVSEDALVVAEKGDILLARVDRNLHEKLGIVVRGRALLTDCVYRIRVPLENQLKAYDALCSENGRKNLLAHTKGVGARIIGKADLLSMPLDLNEN